MRYTVIALWLDNWSDSTAATVSRHDSSRGSFERTYVICTLCMPFVDAIWTDLREIKRPVWLFIAEQASKDSVFKRNTNNWSRDAAKMLIMNHGSVKHEAAMPCGFSSNLPCVVVAENDPKR